LATESFSFGKLVLVLFVALAVSSFFKYIPIEKGVIYDSKTGKPVSDATVVASWVVEYSHYNFVHVTSSRSHLRLVEARTNDKGEFFIWPSFVLIEPPLFSSTRNIGPWLAVITENSEYNIFSSKAEKGVYQIEVNEIEENIIEDTIKNFYESPINHVLYPTLHGSLLTSHNKCAATSIPKTKVLLLKHYHFHKSILYKGCYKKLHRKIRGTPEPEKIKLPPPPRIILTSPSPEIVKKKDDSE